MKGYSALANLIFNNVLICNQRHNFEKFLKKLKYKTVMPSNSKFDIQTAIWHHKAGNFKQAENFYRQILKHADYPEIHYNLGVILKNSSRLEDARRHYEQALLLKPDFAEAHNNLGAVLVELGRFERAFKHYYQAIRLEPNNYEAYYNLANLLKETGELQTACKYYEKAVQLNPHDPEIYNNFGVALDNQCLLDRAVDQYCIALKLKSNFPEAQSNLLFCLNYHPDYSPEYIFNEHCKWGNLQSNFSADSVHLNLPDQVRRLRIGYVSPDFRLHSVAFFLKPILANHDSLKFKIICYSDVSKPDAITKNLKSMADLWRDTCDMSDHQLAELIQKDEIDILVDLAGHSAKNRLLVFARKSAPIQVSYLGYPNTTGLKAMDYRVTDIWADPLEQSYLYTEKLVRLPCGFLVYCPPENSPAISFLPASKGHFTFGSFNNLSKINKYVVRLWSKILLSVPGSRLILKAKPFKDLMIRKRYISLFEKNGLAKNRIKLLNHACSLNEHLAVYNKIDIALDPYPYNGTTTTYEALWMGVPVITLAGNTHASRVGISILTRAGLSDFIAESEDTYVEKAVKLTKDTNLLKRLRANLRAVVCSRLIDAEQFIKSLEKAYCKMQQNRYRLEKVI
ncbi:protein O-GlcNAc transferase [Candidatus Magnetomoraceae bacterium gMMP-15]